MTAIERKMSFLSPGPPLASSSLGLTVALALLVARFSSTPDYYWVEVRDILFWPGLSWCSFAFYIPYVGTLSALSARPSRSTPNPHEVRRGALLLAVIVPGAWVWVGYEIAQIVF